MDGRIAMSEEGHIQVPKTLFSQQVGDLGVFQFPAKGGICHSMISPTWKKVIQLSGDNNSKSSTKPLEHGLHLSHGCSFQVQQWLEGVVLGTFLSKQAW